MSSGASSAQYEKPRTGRSSCGLLTPRSNRIPTIPSLLSPAFPGSVPAADASDDASAIAVLTIAATSSNPPLTIRTRSPKCRSRSPAAATAAGSRSMPRRWRSGRAVRMAVAWPPPPNVASTNNPVGTGRTSSTTSSSITGSCWKAGCAPAPVVTGPSPLGSDPRVRVLVFDRDRQQPPGRVDESEAGGRGACAVPSGGLVASPKACRCQGAAWCQFDRSPRCRTPGGLPSRSARGRPRCRAPTTDLGPRSRCGRTPR